MDALTIRAFIEHVEIGLPIKDKDKKDYVAFSHALRVLLNLPQ